MDIRLHHLSIGYRRGPVVARDINITILGGRLTCLIGDNGIGKSTLLRTLSGFQPKVGGEIWLGSREADSLSQRERSRIISIVLTQRPEMGGLTVHDLVGMGRSPYTGFWGNLAARDELAVRQSLVETGAWPLRDRKIDSLSDGECQKVMIARALAQETPHHSSRRADGLPRLPQSHRHAPAALALGPHHGQDYPPFHPRPPVGCRVG